MHIFDLMMTAVAQERIRGLGVVISSQLTNDVGLIGVTTEPKYDTSWFRMSVTSGAEASSGNVLVLPNRCKVECLQNIHRTSR